MVRGAQPQKRTFRTATEFDVTVERPDGREDVVARGDVIEVRVSRHWTVRNEIGLGSVYHG
jgi:hypothetical protein